MQSCGPPGIEFEPNDLESPENCTVVLLRLRNNLQPI